MTRRFCCRCFGNRCWSCCRCCRPQCWSSFGIQREANLHHLRFQQFPNVLLFLARLSKESINQLWTKIYLEQTLSLILSFHIPLSFYLSLHQSGLTFHASYLGQIFNSKSGCFVVLVVLHNIHLLWHLEVKAQTKMHSHETS